VRQTLSRRLVIAVNEKLGPAAELFFGASFTLRPSLDPWFVSIPGSSRSPVPHCPLTCAA
jgi:hypothetical protein